MGTDAGTPFNKHGSNAMELEFMVDLGIKPIDALRFATANGADLMGLEKQGRISTGMAADFLIVNGDTSEVITMASRQENHLHVVKGGLIVGNAKPGEKGPIFGHMAAF